MSAWHPRITRLIFCILAGTLVGCGGTPQPSGGQPGGDVSVTIPPPVDDPTKPPVPVPTPSTPMRDRLHVAFEDAVSYLAEKAPPLDSNRPPDRTTAGKPSFSLYQQVKSEWDGVRFTSATGKKITWTALIDTGKGPVEVVLYPEEAPNHVRSFLALCRVGYYDGLCFERKHDEVDPEMSTKLEHIEFGCPLGTGEPGNGSIGYWLKPEFNKLPHEEGTLAAIHSGGGDTAACRCYITLSKAAFLDGKYTVFGKVTKGLDVARIIFQQPVAAEDAQRPGSRRLAQPVKINKVILQQQEG